MYKRALQGLKDGKMILKNTFCGVGTFAVLAEEGLELYGREAISDCFSSS